jgi:hypothetical protein
MKTISLLLMLCVLSMSLALAADASGELTVLDIPYRDCAMVEGGGWLAPEMELEAPFAISWVAADDEGFHVAIERIWVQRWIRVHWLFTIGRTRYSRFWTRLAVGNRWSEERGGKCLGLSVEPVYLWDVANDPPGGE